MTSNRGSHMDETQYSILVHSEICEVLRCLHVHFKHGAADRHVFEHAVSSARPAAGGDGERHSREALGGRGRVALRRVARALRLERRPCVHAVRVVHLSAAQRPPRAIDYLWPAQMFIRTYQSPLCLSRLV